jgi:hypothetical protein
MANLYVKYKVAGYRGEDIANIREEIDTTYQKMCTQYKDLECFKKIEEHYKDFLVEFFLCK